MMFVPYARGISADHDCVPVATPDALWSVDHETTEIAFASRAVPLSQMSDAPALNRGLPDDVVEIAITGGVVSTGTVNAIGALVTLPVPTIVSTDHVAAPDASTTPGTAVQMPPEEQPAAAGVSVIAIFPACVASFTRRRYVVTTGDAFHVKIGVGVDTVPDGARSVTGCR